MSRSLCFSLFASFVWSACASSHQDVQPPVRIAEATATKGDVAAAPATATQDPGAAAPADAAGPAWWRDATFRERFAESYLAETDVEPPALAVDEFDALQEVVDLRAQNRVEDAIARLRDLAAPKANATFDLTLAKMLLERDDLAGATASYETAVQKHPKFRRAWHDLALVRYRQGQYRSAVLAFSRVVELGGASPTIYGLLGFSHANSEDWLAAESAFRLAAMLDPARPEWRTGLAHAVLKQQRFAEAATLFGTMIEGQPERGELWLRQAQAFL
ncbi:MAG: tetratricopeptide repeat protein, partial [Planctomycetes bacterium]|nr:tetratricopeptide repeat protein [Planctomycetota bacterium]